MWKRVVFLIVLIALLLLLAKGLRGMWNSWELRPSFGALSTGSAALSTDRNSHNRREWPSLSIGHFRRLATVIGVMAFKI